MVAGMARPKTQAVSIECTHSHNRKFHRTMRGDRWAFSVSRSHLRGFFVCFLMGTACGPHLGADVRGRVTVQNRPLSGLIVFHPKAHGPLAGSVIDRNGYYRLETGSIRSMKPGDYTVCISGTTDGTSGTSSRPPRAGTVVEARYADPATSGLNVTVQSGTNVFDFDLLSGGGAAQETGRLSGSGSR